ncbi:MAG: hypothetical protein AAFX44_15470 [Pseudomonadota bacterium]
MNNTASGTPLFSAVRRWYGARDYVGPARRRDIVQQQQTSWSRSDYLFAAFKYTIYGLLAWNVWLYFQKDFAASQAVFSAGLDARAIIATFASTIDTLAWVVLLLLFELETAVLPDRWLKGWLRWLITAARATCYTVIVYAFTGYVGKLLFVTDLIALDGATACTLLGDALAIESLDIYVALDSARCQSMGTAALWQIDGTDIVGTAADVSLLRQLATTDVVNAGTWLAVVLTLEAEVFAQHRRRLTRHGLLLLQWLKAALYLTLLGCAGFWWLRGTFLDFWDAFLWLLAFVFIELNVFAWQAETATEQRDDSSAALAAP